MKEFNRSAVVAIYFMFCLCVMSVSAHADGVLEGTGITVSGSLDTYSKYVWRGMLLDDDAVIQPGISISGHGLTVSWWGSLDLEGNDTRLSDESDVIVDYTYELDGVSLSAGHTYYTFPEVDAFSKEWYVGVGFDELPLAPSLTVFYDYGDQEDGGGEGTYVSLDLSHSITIEDEYGITLDLGVHAGYNRKLFIVGEGVDYSFSAGLTVPLTDSLSMSPKLVYAIPTGDLEDADDGNQDDNFYAGVSFGYSF
jgi:hypothetical protein